eukprot:TRINITY_DN35184_c0_g1_i1.p1 TRINITY_DN35184_c0_g1~~TRINITY_DN35184_c0_g1_i1.p1  ORF type:complete len:261 (+),score=38.63 TRINITY_DN35184_c0_g1_i1:74-856(+)
MPSKKKYHKGKLASEVHKGAVQNHGGGSFWIRRCKKRPSVPPEEIDRMPGLPSPSLHKTERGLRLKFVCEQVASRKMIEDEEQRERRQHIKQRQVIKDYLEAVMLLRPVSVSPRPPRKLSTKMHWEHVLWSTMYDSALHASSDQESASRQQLEILESRCRRTIRYWSHIAYRNIINPRQIAQMVKRERLARAKLSVALISEFEAQLDVIDLLRWECIDEDRRKAGERLRETINRYNENNGCWNADASFLGIRPFSDAEIY